MCLGMLKKKKKKKKKKNISAIAAVLGGGGGGGFKTGICSKTGVVHTVINTKKTMVTMFTTLKTMVMN